MMEFLALGFFERELKKSEIEVREPTGTEESPAPRDIVDLEVRSFGIKTLLLYKYHKISDTVCTREWYADHVRMARQCHNFKSCAEYA